MKRIPVAIAAITLLAGLSGIAAMAGTTTAPAAQTTSNAPIKKVQKRCMKRTNRKVSSIKKNKISAATPAKTK